MVKLFQLGDQFLQKDIKDQPLLGCHIGREDKGNGLEGTFIITDEAIIADKNNLLKIQNRKENLILREMIVQAMGKGWYVDIRPGVIALISSASVYMIVIDRKGHSRIKAVSGSDIQMLWDTFPLVNKVELREKIENWATENAHNHFITLYHLFSQAILKDNDKGNRKIWKFERYVDENTTSIIEAKKDRDTFNMRETYFYNKDIINVIEFGVTAGEKRWNCGEVAQYCVDNGYFFVENNETSIHDVLEAPHLYSHKYVGKEIKRGRNKSAWIQLILDY
jgi:hypothetical protein